MAFFKSLVLVFVCSHFKNTEVNTQTETNYSLK